MGILNGRGDAMLDSEDDYTDEDKEMEKIDSEEEDAESSRAEYDIISYPADPTLEVLHNQYTNNELIVPKFQRGYIWSIGQASRLIESFLLNLPVPQIFLYEDDEKKCEIIDGQQRLKSIFY